MNERASKIKLILLADDDEEDVLFFKEAIADLDIVTQITVAENGVMLMNVLEKTSTLPDMIFLDLNMPLKNGLQCLKEIRANERWRLLKTVILSTSSDERQKEESYKQGADVFLTKPNSFRELKKMLAECLQ